MYYSLNFAVSARKDLQILPFHIAGKIIHKIEQLAENPRPPGIKKLKGSTNLFRIRVGEYRIVYEIDNKNRVIDIAVIRHRRDAYR